MREITLSQAVNEALAEEMRRDETVFIIGEDVAEAGTPFKILSGLVEDCLLYTSPSPRDRQKSRMPSSA